MARPTRPGALSEIEVAYLMIAARAEEDHLAYEVGIAELVERIERKVRRKLYRQRYVDVGRSVFNGWTEMEMKAVWEFCPHLVDEEYFDHVR